MGRAGSDPALAAILRLGAPGITEFKRDEGNLSQLALDLVHGRDLPLLGLSSSVNVPNPPISVYLFAVPFVFSDSPIPATLFVGVLNVIAVGLAWGLARRYYGPRRGPHRGSAVRGESLGGDLFAQNLGAGFAAAVRRGDGLHRAARLRRGQTLGALGSLAAAGDHRADPLRRVYADPAQPADAGAVAAARSGGAIC